MPRWSRIVVRGAFVAAAVLSTSRDPVRLPESTSCDWSHPCLAAAVQPGDAQSSSQSLMGVVRTNELMAAPPLAPRADDVRAIDVPLHTLSAEVQQRLGPTARRDAVTSAMHADLTFVGATGQGLGVPDTMGAVGPTQYLVVLNSIVRSFDKHTGTQDGVLDLGLQSFFEPTGYNVCCDPKVRFDRMSGRWLVGAFSAQTTGRVLLAVSTSATLTAQSGWTFFSFAQDQATPAGDPGCAVDYTRMSVDAHAIYFVFGMFASNYQTTCPTNSKSSSLFVIRKASVLGAGPLVVAAFRGVAYFQVPVDQFDAVSEVGFVTTQFHPTQSGSFYRVLDPGGTPSLSSEIPYSGVNVLGKAGLRSVRHKDNNLESGVPSNVTGRMFIANSTSHSVPFRNGRLWVGDLWGVNRTGTIQIFQDGSTDATRNGLSFIEVSDVTSASASVVQSGILFTPSPANDFDQRNYWIPALMVTGQGHLVLSGSAAGTNEYIGAAFASRLATDPPGTLRPPTLYAVGAAPFNPLVGAGQTRPWGDYSNISLDPCDDMTVWTIQQFTAAADTWAVAVARIRAPAPPAVSAVTPSTLPYNTSSVSVTITGAPTDGEGFFDPGAGFSCRLAASISAGVIVNSVTFTSPTSVTLNVSTAGASGGVRTVTLTNPDGQTSSTSVTVQSSYVFTDDPLTANVSTIRAVHLSELRAIIDEQRSHVGLAPYSYTTSSLVAGSTIIRALDVVETRTALAQAYVADGRDAPTYTDPVLSSGSLIKAVHISQLRDAIRVFQ